MTPLLTVFMTFFSTLVLMVMGFCKKFAAQLTSIS
jgi:hypothetical protein